MKNKETLILIVILVVSFFLFCSCSTRKAVTKESESQVQQVQRTWAKDSSILDYTVDTSQTCDQTITFEVVDYYPSIDTASHIQPIKQIRRKVVSKATTRKGITENKQAEVKQVDAVQAKDSTGTAKVIEKTTKPSTISRIWLWLILILLAIFGIMYIVNKRK